MSVSGGTRFGPYEIVSAIGAGGMGEVYRATDTNLKRDVAIKVLPESFVNDANRLARFQREAEVLALLNHVNIAHIYGLERGEETTALVMELVEGPTLADRIAQGALAQSDALNIALQIAAALEAAHEQGIVHRDLKPANVKLKPDGTVKVLDFGIAKALDTRIVSGPQAPQLTTPAMTAAGLVLGTAAYMAPEQARGRAVDKRTDIWAFGCVLYEMLTGQPAFGGEDVPITLARVLDRDTDLNALPDSIAPNVRHTIELCLQKDVKRRIADIRDVRLALEGRFGFAPQDRAGAGAPDAKRSFRRSMLALAGAVIITGIVVGFAVWSFTQPSPPALVRLSLLHMGPDRVGLTENDANIAISRDGRSVVYAAGASDDFAGVSTLRVRALDALEPMVISNLGRTPFFSPDGEWIGYSTDNGIERVARAGGPALPISSAGSGIRGASWNVDDTIVFATSDPSSGLFRIPAAGAETETLTTPDATRGELDHLFPRFLPDGRHLLFTITTAEGIANAQIAVLDLESRDYRVLIRGGSDAHYASSGHIVYGSLGNLLAVPFDLARLEVLGSPEPVVQGVATKATGAASFAVSDGGTLVYIPGGAVQSVQRTLVWVDRKGSEEPIPVPLRNYHYAQLSPDGQRIALDVRDQENDVWIWDLERQSLQRLTFDPGFNRGPVWSPDGSRVAFSRALDGREEVYWQPWDGSGLPEPLTAGSPAAMLPTDISTDGKTLFFMQASRPRDVLMISIGEEVSAGTPILAGPASEEGAMLSPDGRWLAYQSNESGEWQIYVRPFPDLERGRWQVSTNEGTRPRWSRSGRELFYYFTTGRTGGLMAVTVTTDPGFRAGTPRRLFEGDYQAPNQGRHVYDVSLDDQRFLMIKGLETVDDEEAPQIVVVENWFEELERLVPTE